MAVSESIGTLVTEATAKRVDCPKAPLGSTSIMAGQGTDEQLPKPMSTNISHNL
jgi:hypothetical protein